MTAGTFVKPDTGNAAVQKFHSRLFQRGDYPVKRLGPGAYGTVKPFHPPQGSESHFSLLGEIGLRPPKKRPGRPDVPACDYDQ